LNIDFETGEFRAAYAAAGPLAVDILDSSYGPLGLKPAEKFDSPDPELAASISASNANFAIIPFDLGFPPGKNEEQEKFFSGFVSMLEDEGVEAIALLTPSSYVAEGEFNKADRAARLPGGKPVYYSGGGRRVMACWNSAGWRARQQEMVERAMAAGAGGILLDALCFGAAPVLIGDRFEGPAGCHCPACREQFAGYTKNETGKALKIPKKLDLSREDSRMFVKWRAGVVTEALERLLAAVKSAGGDAVFAVNVPHVATQPVLPLFGVDPEWAGVKPDVLFMEHNRRASISKEGLVYGTAAYRVLEAVCRGPIPAELGYSFGPSADAVASPGEYSSAAALSFANGISPVIRTGEYRDLEEDLACDYLLRKKYPDRIEAAAAVYNWVDKDRDLFEGAAPVARVCVMFSWELMSSVPGSGFLENFYTILNSLIELQVPVGVGAAGMLEEEAVKETKVAVIPAGGDGAGVFRDSIEKFNGDTRLIFAGDVPGWANPERSRSLPEGVIGGRGKGAGKLFGKGFGSKLLAKLYAGNPGLYGGFPMSRRAGLPPPGISSFPSVFAMYQPPEKWQELRDAVTGELKHSGRGVEYEAPPYIHIQEWKKGSDAYFHAVHLLPGFPGPDAAVIRLPKAAGGRVLYADTGRITYFSGENAVMVKPNPYAVVHARNMYG